MKVKFTKNWLGYKKGQVVSFPADSPLVEMLLQKEAVIPLHLNTMEKNYKTK